MKYTGTLKNAAGGKVPTVAEAVVSGTMHDPVVTDVLIYGVNG